MGILVNTLAIVIGTLIGVVFNKHIKESYKHRVMQLMGVVSLYMGTTSIYNEFGTIKNLKLLFLIVVLGAFIGRLINLEGKMENINKKFDGESPIQGVILGFVLFCVGALSIVGPIKCALEGDNSLLYLNAVLSGVTSIVLSMSYGLYILAVSAILFIWQGTIYLVAGALSSIMTPEVINQLSLIGSFLILASGINILKLGRVKTLNFLPTLSLPILINIFNVIM